jgi:hypothetical protein
MLKIAQSNWTIFCICVLFSSSVQAWSLGDFFGPSIDKMGFNYLFRPPTAAETARYSSPMVVQYTPTKVLAVVIKNNTEYYVSKAVISCSLFDSSKNRFAKDVLVYMPDDEYGTVAKAAAIAPGNTQEWRKEFWGNDKEFSAAVDAECKLVKVSGEK